jgi:hypothetical protein
VESKDLEHAYTETSAKRHSHAAVWEDGENSFRPLQPGPSPSGSFDLVIVRQRTITFAQDDTYLRALLRWLLKQLGIYRRVDLNRGVLHRA